MTTTWTAPVSATVSYTVYLSDLGRNRGWPMCFVRDFAQYCADIWAIEMRDFQNEGNGLKLNVRTSDGDRGPDEGLAVTVTGAHNAWAREQIAHAIRMDLTSPDQLWDNFCRSGPLF